MPPDLVNILAAFGVFALLACFVVGVGLLLWKCAPGDGEHSPRICDHLWQTRNGPKRCDHLAIPGKAYCREHAPVIVLYGGQSSG